MRKWKIVLKELKKSYKIIEMWLSDMKLMSFGNCTWFDRKFQCFFADVNSWIPKPSKWAVERSSSFTMYTTRVISMLKTFINFWQKVCFGLTSFCFGNSYYSAAWSGSDISHFFRQNAGVTHLRNGKITTRTVKSQFEVLKNDKCLLIVKDFPFSLGKR